MVVAIRQLTWGNGLLRFARTALALRFMKLLFCIAMMFAIACGATGTNNASDGSLQDTLDPNALVTMPNRMLQGGRVLLIGNSHTSFSTTGTRVGEIWRMLNSDFAIDTIASPGLTLADHAGNDTTLLALEEGVRSAGPYDAVVLQEQSARYLQAQNYDLTAAQTLADAARRGNPCVLIVFSQIQVDESASNYEAALIRFRETSQRVAEELHGLYAPTGDVFANVRSEDATLYNALLENTSCCGWHAKPLGGYVHALTLDMLLTGRAADGYTALQFDAAQAMALRSEAGAVFAERNMFRQHLALPQRCARP